MIYRTIAKNLRARINSNEYQVGDNLPSEKKLAEMCSVSRMTVRHAIDLLIVAGLVYRKHGSGTYIKKKDVQHETTGLKGLIEVLTDTGHIIKSKVTEFQMIKAPSAVANKLKIRVDEKLFYSRRVRLVDDKPLVIEDSYMPAKIFSNLTLAHLEGSKFDYIEKECHIKIAGSYESFDPIIADSSISELLYLHNPLIPILRVNTLTYSDQGDFINYAVMYRNTQDYRVEYHLRR